MNHTERVQDLYLHLPCTWFKNHFRFPPAPRLQNLKISGGYQKVHSQAFFGGDTPALRILELSFCLVPWHSFTLNDLTTLKLRSVSSQNMVEFLSALSYAQNLRHLYLEDALASAAGFLSNTQFHSFQKIILPYLSRLLIVAPLSTVIAFLACVNIPMKTKVRLDCGFENSSSLHDYASLFSVLAQRFSMSTSEEPSSPTFRSLVIDLSGFREELAFSSLECDFDSFGLTTRQDWGCNTPLKIRVCWFTSNTRRDLDSFIGSTPSFVPLMDVQSLHVIEPPALPAIWRSMLEHLQDLRYLKLSDGDLPDLAPVLSLTDPTTSESAEGQGDQSPDRMLAPALEELELYDISFRKRSKKDDCLVDVQALCDALVTRKGSNTRLTLTRCTRRVAKVRSVQDKCFNMVRVWWEGRFCMIEVPLTLKRRAT